TSAECSTASGLLLVGVDFEVIPHALQVLASSAFEPIRYCILPLIWCCLKNAATVLGVSPTGSTETAMIWSLCASAPSSCWAVWRLATISGQTSGQWS